jgi:hypothetical protein
MEEHVPFIVVKDVSKALPSQLYAIHLRLDHSLSHIFGFILETLTFQLILIFFFWLNHSFFYFVPKTLPSQLKAKCSFFVPSFLSLFF